MKKLIFGFVFSVLSFICSVQVNAASTTATGQVTFLGVQFDPTGEDLVIFAIDGSFHSYTRPPGTTSVLASAKANSKSVTLQLNNSIITNVTLN